jgi:hypothetical protein
MKQFTETRFFRLMETSSTQNHSPELVRDAYEEFADALFLERSKIPDMNTFFNTVCYTQAELEHLRRKLIKGKKHLTRLSIWTGLSCSLKHRLILPGTDCCSLSGMYRQRLFPK